MNEKSNVARKVLILGPAYPYRGGLAAFNERLGKALQDAGCEVLLVTFSFQYPSLLFPGKTQFAEGPATIELLIVRWIHSLNPLNWWKAAQQIRRESPDLIITAFWLPLLGPALGTILRLIKRPGVHRIGLIHNMLPHEGRPGDRLFSRYFVKAGDNFLTLSKEVSEQVRLFSDSQEIVCSPHPIYDHYGELLAKQDARRSLGLTENGRYLLFFGFIRAYKGLDLLLKAMADKHLEDENVQLVVAGEFYQDEQTYLDLISELGIQDRVHLHSDFIPDDQVRHYFCAADLVVQPYKTATQSGISQIAYHFERPMIVTRVGGLPEIVPDGEAGYVVEPQPAAIAAAIVDFYEHQREEELAQGVRAGKDRFSWRRLVDLILELDQRWRASNT